MKVKINKDTVIETDNLTLAELLATDDNLFARIKEIEAEVREAKGNAKLNGVYQDPDWFARANFALSISKHNRERLQRAIVQKRKEEKGQKHQAEGARFERLFMKVTKEFLPPEVYQCLITRVHTLAREEGEDNFSLDGQQLVASPEAIELLKTQVE